MVLSEPEFTPGSQTDRNPQQGPQPESKQQPDPDPEPEPELGLGQSMMTEGYSRLTHARIREQGVQYLSNK